MAIYKMTGNKEGLEEVAPTSFGKEGVLERSDLQRLLRDKPRMLEEGLLIISEEFGNWEDSKRSIDLLGLDANGRLVVIELKRGETGEHMDLQAIRYAAMVANMTFQQAADALQAYLKKRAKGGTEIEQDAAKTKLREHLSTSEEDPSIDTEVPRIILASENFSKELTTCVLWLNASSLPSKAIDIKCIRLQPHRNGDEILLEVATLIPLPEASAYQIQIAERQQETRGQSSGRSKRAPGADVFKEQIARSPQEYQPDLHKLYNAALGLQQDGLAELVTFESGSGNNYRIELQLQGTTDVLVSFSLLHFAGGMGEISVWPVLENRAPKASSRIDKAIGEVTSASRVRHRKLSMPKTSSSLDEILGAIHSAYREANNGPLNSESSGHPTGAKDAAEQSSNLMTVTSSDD